MLTNVSHWMSESVRKDVLSNAKSIVKLGSLFVMAVAAIFSDRGRSRARVQGVGHAQQAKITLNTKGKPIEAIQVYLIQA